MKKTTLATIVIVIIGFIVLSVLKALMPNLQNAYTRNTSDARATKGEINIALDSWIGYFPLQSPVLKKLMREEGYRLNIIDDKADYDLRMSELDKGNLDFAVCTVDSYLINGDKYDYPGTIVSIIDESKGGDAIVAWKDKVDSIEKLKSNINNIKIAYTPASPSEHLIKSLAIHFGIDSLMDKSIPWKLETGGAKEAYKKLISGKSEVAVLWEPFVSEAVSNPDIIKILGSEDTEKLIVDILLVNREWAKDNRELSGIFIKNLFKTQQYYSENPEILVEDIKHSTKTDKDKINSMLEGVKWISLSENARWMGINGGNIYSEEELIKSIDSAIRILTETEDFNSNPLPNSDPYTIIDSSFIEKEFMITGDTGDVDYTDSLQKNFKELTPAQWNKMSVVGSLKILPITFQSGTSELDLNGEEQVDIITDTISHYPNFRIIVKGHTGQRGDQQANKELSRSRADSVKDYFISRYNVDKNRIRAIGLGGDEPLKRKDGESSRSYNDRLKRVEIFLVSF